MCITEYDEERTRAEQREEDALDILTSLVKKGLLTLAQAAEEAQMSVAEFEAKTYIENSEEGFPKDFTERFAKRFSEGFADGITDVRLQSLAKGEEKGTLAVLTSLMKKGIITLEQAAEEAQMTVAEFEAKTNSMT